MRVGWTSSSSSSSQDKFRPVFSNKSLFIAVRELLYIRFIPRWNQIIKKRKKKEEEDAKSKLMILILSFMFVRIINLIAVVIGKHSSFITIRVLLLLGPIIVIIIFIIPISVGSTVTKTDKQKRISSCPWSPLISLTSVRSSTSSAEVQRSSSRDSCCRAIGRPFVREDVP